MRSHLDAVCVLLLISASALMPARSAAQEPSAPEPQAGLAGRLRLDPEVRADRLWVRVFEAGRPCIDTRRDRPLARVLVDPQGHFRATGLDLDAVDLLLETTGDHRYLVLQANVLLKEGVVRQLADIDLRGRVRCCVVRMQAPSGDALARAVLLVTSTPRRFETFPVPCEGGVAIVTSAGRESLRYWADAPGFRGCWIDDLRSDLTLTLEPVPVLRLRLRRELHDARDTRITLTPIRSGALPGAGESDALVGRIGEARTIEVEIDREGLYRLEVEQRERGAPTYSGVPSTFQRLPDAMPRVFELRGPVTEVEIGLGPRVRSVGPERDSAGVEGRLLLDPDVPTDELRLWISKRQLGPVTRGLLPLALVAIDDAGRFRAAGLPATNVDLALAAPSDYRLRPLLRNLRLEPGKVIQIPAMDLRDRIHCCRVRAQDPGGKPVPAATISDPSLGERAMDWARDASRGPVLLVTATRPRPFIADAFGFRAATIPFDSPEHTVILHPTPVVSLYFDLSLFPSTYGQIPFTATLTRLGDPATSHDDPAAEPMQIRRTHTVLTLEVAAEGRYRLEVHARDHFTALEMRSVPIRPSVIDVRGPLTKVTVYPGRLESH